MLLYRSASSGPVSHLPHTSPLSANGSLIFHCATILQRCAGRQASSCQCIAMRRKCDPISREAAVLAYSPSVPRAARTNHRTHQSCRLPNLLEVSAREAKSNQLERKREDVEEGSFAIGGGCLAQRGRAAAQELGEGDDALSEMLPRTSRTQVRKCSGERGGERYKREGRLDGGRGVSVLRNNTGELDLLQKTYLLHLEVALRHDYAGRSCVDLGLAVHQSLRPAAFRR
jgi:hypothetical protein